MSDRPIEEVMGWRQADVLGWIRRDGTYADQADVDDLCVWLDEHEGYGCWSIRTHRGYYITAQSGAYQTDSFPGIWQALEAAVRKLAGDAA
jgi:hypothetical protein